MIVCLQPNLIKSYLDQLLDLKIHPQFAGYLCIKRTAKRDGRTTDLSPDFTEFFETFLSVQGGPTDKPYYRHFWNQSSSRQKAWQNRNLAGSYSPSSLRSVISRNYSL